MLFLSFAQELTLQPCLAGLPLHFWTVLHIGVVLLLGTGSSGCITYSAGPGPFGAWTWFYPIPVPQWGQQASRIRPWEGSSFAAFPLVLSRTVGATGLECRHRYGSEQAHFLHFQSLPGELASLQALGTWFRILQCIGLLLFLGSRAQEPLSLQALGPWFPKLSGTRPGHPGCPRASRTDPAGYYTRKPLGGNARGKPTTLRVPEGS